MAELKEELRAAIEASHDDLLALARSVLATGLSTETPEQQLEQLVRALVAMLLEGLEGRTETRDFVIETALPAYVEAGESASSIAGASVRFAVQLADLLASRVSAENRAAAIEWTADYYATYTCLTIEAVTR